MTTEIISAEVALLGAKVNYDDSVSPELIRQKDEINERLQKYINEADRLDYSIAVASGVLCGIIDSLFVGEFSLENIQKQGTALVEKIVTKTAKEKGFSGSEFPQAVKFLEDKYPIAADKATNDFGGGLQHHLRDFSHHPTVVGLFCSILTQFTHKVYGTDTNGTYKIVEINDGALELIGNNIPKKFELGAINWFFHMVSDMGGSYNSAKEGSLGTGLPGPIVSLLKELSALPIFKSTNEKGYKELSVWISKLFNGTLLGKRDANGKVVEALQFDLRTEIGLSLEIGKHMLPVIINECLVRGFYFIRRFVQEVQKAQIDSIKDLADLNWRRTLPANNRTIARMISVSSATFTAADVADAAIRGAIESAGNTAIFAAKFVSRVNYVGTARLAVAVVNEVKMELEEEKLVHERRIIIEKLSEEEIELIRAYRQKIQSLVEQYMAEDLEGFLMGIDAIDEGTAGNDTNRFIEGNVTIQKILGREIQFSTQQEFDTLMLSDEAFKL